jgi:capsular exopolysaccharide synthesis family protein
MADGVVTQLQPAPEPQRDTLSTFLEVLRRRWLIVIGVVLACLLAAFVRSETGAKRYDATASVTFGASSLPDAALNVSRGSGDPVRDAATNVLVASSLEVATGVRAELHSSASPSALVSAIGVQAAPNANVLNITASTSDPGYSARLANAFADQYIAFETQSQVGSLDSVQKLLQQQIRTLPVGSADRAVAVQSLQRLGELRAVASSGTQIISRATTPSLPSGTTVKTSLILGLLIGIALALLIVFLLESLDRRINSIEAFEREYRLPALAGVPQSAFKGRRAHDRDEELEPYRILRSALDFAAVTRRLDTLLVTSAVSSEGKTSVAVDLAHAVALTGRQVVLVELDLRRPTFSQHFQLDPRNGITTALTQQEAVGDLLVQPFADLPNLSVLPSGQLPPNPSELLGSPVLAETLFELSSANGIVVIDAPPLNPVADAQVLLNTSAIHGAIVVARLGRTTRDEVRRARAILDRHMLQPVGIVVTGLRDASRYGYKPDRPLASGPMIVGGDAPTPSASAPSRRRASY